MDMKLIKQTPQQQQSVQYQINSERTATICNFGSFNFSKIPRNGSVKHFSNEKKNIDFDGALFKKGALELNEQGNIFNRSGEYERAIEKYTAAIQLDDKEVKFYTNRSLCYLHLEKYDKCQADCDKALSLDSRNIKALYRRAQVNEKRKQYTQALECYNKILKYDPNNNEASKGIERVKQNIIRNDLEIDSKKFLKEYKDDVPKFTKTSIKMKEIEACSKEMSLRSKKQLKSIHIEEVTDSYFCNDLIVTDKLIDEVFNSFDPYPPTFTASKDKLRIVTQISVENENEENVPTNETSTRDSPVNSKEITPFAAGKKPDTEIVKKEIDPPSIKKFDIDAIGSNLPLKIKEFKNPTAYLGAYVLPKMPTPAKKESTVRTNIASVSSPIKGEESKLVVKNVPKESSNTGIQSRSKKLMAFAYVSIFVFIIVGYFKTEPMSVRQWCWSSG